MVWSSFLRSHRGTNVLSVVRPASDHNTAQFLLHPPHTGAATSQRQVASHVRRYQTKFVSSTGTSEVKVVAWWTATRSSNIASPPHSANSDLAFFLFLHFINKKLTVPVLPPRSGGRRRAFSRSLKMCTRNHTHLGSLNPPFSRD